MGPRLHRRGEPVYRPKPVGPGFEQDLYTGTELKQALGNEARLNIGGEQAFYLADDQQEAALEYFRIDADGTDGMADGVLHRGIDELNLTTGGGADDITVVTTITGPTLIETNGGADRVAVQSIEGDTTVLLGGGNDAIRVGTGAGFWPDGFYAAKGLVDEINAFLDIDGGTGTDSLELDDTADTSANTGTLERVGDHAELRGLGLTSAGIDYSTLEQVAVNLGSGNDTFTVESTHDYSLADGLVLEGRGGDDSFRIKTTDTHTRVAGDGFAPNEVHGSNLLPTGTGADTVIVGTLAPLTAGGVLDEINGILEIRGSSSAGASDPGDRLLVDDTGDASSNIGYVDARTIAGLDMTKTTFGVRPDRTNTVTLRNVVDGRFTLTLGGETTTQLDFDAFAWEVRDALEALAAVGPGEVEVVRTGGAYVITFRGLLSGDAGWALGGLSANDVSLVGAGKSIAAAVMSEGRIDYLYFEALELGLGSGDDVLGVHSTHAGTTLVNAGPGADRLTVETVAGATDVNGEAGDDVVLVNALFGIPGPLAGGLEEQGIDAPLNIDGGFGADSTTINLFGNGESFIDVTDSGFDGMSNFLTVNGTHLADVFLLRAELISLLSGRVADPLLPYEKWTFAERVTYDDSINAGVILNAGGGDDKVALDDTSSLLTVNGEDGNDTFQVGQLVDDNVLKFDERYPDPSLTDTTMGRSDQRDLVPGDDQRRPRRRPLQGLPQPGAAQPQRRAGRRRLRDPDLHHGRRADLRRHGRGP